MKRQKGHTLLEVCFVLGIVGFLIAVSLSGMNFGSSGEDTAINKYLINVSTIELAYNTYIAEKRTALVDTNGNGNMLDELSSYVFPPSVPSGFDSTYGYVLNTSAGQVYICSRSQISGSGDANVNTLKGIKSKLAAGKFYYADTCPSTTDAVLDTAKTVYSVTYIVK